MKGRATAYTRVSTDHLDQINSLENQKQFWEDFINSNPELEFCGIYADEGITGTSTLNRTEFNKMIREVEEKKIDVILTKEVSRFARNTLDTLKYTRYLKEKGIGVFFYLDNIFTLDSDGELRLSIMASLAQDESRRTSERVKFGHRKSMDRGFVFGANRILGYRLEKGILVIFEEEAIIVRKIYYWYLAGESLHGIVRLLKEMGLTGKLGGELNHTSIRRILENEKYCGDLIQKKYYTKDYLTHKRVKNNGEEDFVIIRDHHEAIIDRETWNRVQIKLRENRIKREEQGIGYSKHEWGGKLVCSQCGNKFRRKVMKNKDGSLRPVWICTSFYEHGKKACTNGSYIREDLLEDVFMSMIRRMVTDHDRQTLIRNFIIALEKVLDDQGFGQDLDAIRNQLAQVKGKRARLLDLYMDSGSLSKANFNEKNDELNRKENRLYEELELIENRANMLNDKKARLEKLLEVLNREIRLEDFNPEFVREYLERIEIEKGVLRIYLTFGKEEVNLSKYPKRVDGRDRQPGRPLE